MFTKRIIFLHFQQIVLTPTIAKFARPDFWLRQTALTPIRGARRRAQSPAEQYLTWKIKIYLISESLSQASERAHLTEKGITYFASLSKLELFHPKSKLELTGKLSSLQVLGVRQNSNSTTRSRPNSYFLHPESKLEIKLSPLQVLAVQKLISLLRMQRRFPRVA